MGNALRCFKGEDDHAGGGVHYPYYYPTSRPSHILQPGTYDRPAAPPTPTHQLVTGRHGATAAVAAGVVGLAAAPYLGHRQGSSEILGNRVVASKHQCNTDKYIDESSAEALCAAESYAKAHPMLIQVRVVGAAAGKTFWRLTDEAARISRKLALILRSHHLVGKHLAAPLQVSNVWISSSGSAVKLTGVRFSRKSSSFKRVRDDYKDLSRVLQALIRISGGDVTKLPPDYKEFLALLASDTLTKRDEFLIVNNPALLPMSNRTEVFLMLYDRIVTDFGPSNDGKAKKKRILSKLPYKKDWLDTAIANKEINKWVTTTQKQYRKTQQDQLRLNRNVRSHLRQYNDENMEEILYFEWPELLMDMVKMFHVEDELQKTDIQNKFG